MPQMTQLVAVLEAARERLAAADTDFTWSSWRDQRDALEEIDTLLSELRSGVLPSAGTLRVLFAPTGPLQEVSLSSGWGDAFIALAGRFDNAMASDDKQERGSI
jgi:hypothetical protein